MQLRDASVKFYTRFATNEDAPHFAAIERSACKRFRTIADLAWIADEEPTAIEEHFTLISAGTVWIAEDGSGKISGFLLAERCGEELHICEFAVEHPRQGQGIGTLLLQAAIAYARAMGLKALTLTTFRELSWNEPFYHHSGFETLAASDLNERLVAAFAREVLIGLPIGRRCAMRLVLSRLR